jgi:hypothetical protein
MPGFRSSGFLFMGHARNPCLWGSSPIWRSLFEGWLAVRKRLTWNIPLSHSSGSRVECSSIKEDMGMKIGHDDLWQSSVENVMQSKDSWL